LNYEQKKHYSTVLALRLANIFKIEVGEIFQLDDDDW